MSNSLDPDQNRLNVGPDLDLNCQQRLSADDTSYYKQGLLFEKTYLIVIKDETGLKSKQNDSTLILIGSYGRRLVASYLQKRGDNSIPEEKGIVKYEFRNNYLQFKIILFS